MAVDLQDLSNRLFKTANQLWANTSLRPDQYAQPVLALIALRQMEAKFELVKAELAKTFTGRLKPQPEDYQARGAIYLPDDARFSRLMALPETENLAAAPNKAMKGITETNPDLAGVLPQAYGALPDPVLWWKSSRCWWPSTTPAPSTQSGFSRALRHSLPRWTRRNSAR